MLYNYLLYDLQLLFLGYTPMHFAASWGQVSCLEALFEAGANIDARSCHGETPKQIAVRYDKKQSIEFLDWAGKLYIMCNRNGFLSCFLCLTLVLPCVDIERTVELEKKTTKKKK